MMRAGEGDHIRFPAGALGKLAKEVGGHEFGVRELPDEAQAFAIGPCPDYYTVAVNANGPGSIHKYSHKEPPCLFFAILGQVRPRQSPQSGTTSTLAPRTKSGQGESFQIGDRTVHRFRKACPCAATGDAGEVVDSTKFSSRRCGWTHRGAQTRLAERVLSSGRRAGKPQRDDTLHMGSRYRILPAILFCAESFAGDAA